MFMTRRFGRDMLVVTFLLGAPIAINSAPAAPLRSSAEPAIPIATDISSRRSNRHAHARHANRQYTQTYYYDRPRYYRPYPYSLPAPFVFGFGPWVW
jgi:hypothetical protein